MVFLYEFTGVQRPPVSSSGNEYQLHASPRPLFPSLSSAATKPPTSHQKKLFKPLQVPGGRLRSHRFGAGTSHLGTYANPPCLGLQTSGVSTFWSIQGPSRRSICRAVAPNCVSKFPFSFFPFLFLASHGFLLYFMVIVPHSQPRKPLVFQIEVWGLDRFTQEGRSYDWM